MAEYLVSSLAHRFVRNCVYVCTLLLLLFTLQGAARAQTGYTWNGIIGAEDVTYDGSVASSGFSGIWREALSADGRFLTFDSMKTNLVPNDVNAVADAFVRDRWAQQTEMISIGMDGLPANGMSWRPAISSNGLHVAFLSCATNLVPGDTNGKCDVFVRDRLLGVTSLVSVGPVGEQAQHDSESFYGLSADGRYIAFVASFTSNYFDRRIWLRDRDTDGNGVFDEAGGVGTTQISVSTVDSASLSYVYCVAISGNGRVITYTADATQDGASGHMLFAYDRETGQTVRVDMPVAGLPDVPGDSYWPDLDDAGRFIVYTSTAPNLVMDDDDDVQDLFVYDMETGTNTRLRLSHPGAPSLQGWYNPSISGDGRYVAFSGMVEVAGGGVIYHSFAIDRQVGSYEISVNADGTPDETGNGGLTIISSDGSTIVFDGSGNVVNDPPPNSNIFVAMDLALSPATVQIGSGGGSFPLLVTAPENIPWTIHSPSPDLITMIDPASGVGQAMADVYISSNEYGPARDMFVYIGSERVLIHQSAPQFSLMAVVPSYGHIGGGTRVRIEGRAFEPGSTVSFGGVQGTDIEFWNSTILFVKTPPSASFGMVDVVVTNPDGSESRLASAFTYRDTTPPVLVWQKPLCITYGTPLGATQLNASANVPGTFTYEPAAGTILNPGDFTLTVTFVPDDAANYATASMSTSITVLKLSPHITWLPPANIAYGTPLGESQLNATVDVPGVLTYRQPAGTVLSVGTHLLAVTFVPNDQTIYGDTSWSVWITVQKATPTITWANPASITYEMRLTSAQLNATANVAGTFTYTPALGALLPAGTHTLTVNFQPSDTTNYENASASVELRVAKWFASLTWAPYGSITYGTSLSGVQYSVTASKPGTFTFTPPMGTILPAGTHQLTVLFEPTDSSNYSNVTLLGQITVNKAVPQVSWPPPGSITYGMPLSAAQLSATANVPGVFRYTPDFGTILPFGQSVLSAVFTPTDTANYVEKNLSVFLWVNQVLLTVQTDTVTKVYGQELPVFTATGTGFVAGDSMASLSGTLSFTGSANASSAPGNYSVMPGGVSSTNYIVFFQTGILTILKASTSTTLTTNPNPSSNRQQVQLTASVAAIAPGAGSPSGYVQFLDNGASLGSIPVINGIATVNVTFKKGTHSLTAVYAGDSNFTGSSGAQIQQVR